MNSNFVGNPFINVQILCDANSEILNIDTKYAGTIKESAIWQISEVRELLKKRFESGDNSTWHIGDKGYPLEPWLKTPVLGVTENESPDESTYAGCSSYYPTNTTSLTILHSAGLMVGHIR